VIGVYRILRMVNPKSCPSDDLLEDYPFVLSYLAHRGRRPLDLWNDSTAHFEEG